MRYFPAAAILCSALTLAACSSGPKASYHVTTVRHVAVSTAQLAVTVSVRNTSQVAGTPSCTIEARDPSYSHHGVDIATLRDPVQPGKTATFVDELTITSHGANDVTSVKVSCD